MESAYAQALWLAIAKGKDPKDAMSALVKILDSQGRMGLLPRIGKSFKRLADKEKAKRTKIFVARETDAHMARAASGAKDADIVIDESLIGGWRLERAGEVQDKSFKSALISIYSKITN